MENDSDLGRWNVNIEPIDQVFDDINEESNWEDYSEHESGSKIEQHETELSEDTEILADDGHFQKFL